MEYLNCCFQYATSPRYGGVQIEEIYPISLEQAVKLWNERKQKFITDFQDDRNPEMAISQNMSHETDYGDEYARLSCLDKIVIRDGEIYKLTKVEP